MCRPKIMGRAGARPSRWIERSALDDRLAAEPRIIKHRAAERTIHQTRVAPILLDALLVPSRTRPCRQRQRSEVGGAQLLDGAEMVVIVFGHKKTQIDDGHRLLKARM